jgi:hypothetical protein
VRFVDRSDGGVGGAENLPSRVPGALGSPFAAPWWDPYASGRIAVGPEVLERVHTALERL